MENEKLIIPQLVSLDEPLGIDKDSVIKTLAAKIATSGRAEPVSYTHLTLPTILLV